MYVSELMIESKVIEFFLRRSYFKQNLRRLIERKKQRYTVIDEALLL